MYTRLTCLSLDAVLSCGKLAAPSELGPRRVWFLAAYRGMAPAAPSVSFDCLSLLKTYTKSLSTRGRALADRNNVSAGRLTCC
jgi:hypothetical protein